MNKNISLRPARGEDLDALSSLVEKVELMPGDMLAHSMAPYFDTLPDNEICVIAELDGEIIGFYYARQEEMAHNVWNMLIIAVDRDNQSKGIGRTLIAHLEQTLRDQNQRILIIDTSSDDQFIKTQKFYQDLGFERTATIPDFWTDGEDKITYYKRL
ncbi:MAG: GNAT family N-acetyltransferase [Rhizobiaceae bacterium]|nr:GNAT family N-acetyltransferase [Rhizobiaceae bacterium]